MPRDGWFTTRWSALQFDYGRQCQYSGHCTQWGPLFVCATTRGGSSYSKNDLPLYFEKRVTDAMLVFIVDAALPYQWPNFSSVWMLAMKTLNSLLRIQISYRKWSRWMKVGCITTTHSPNRRVNTGSALTSGKCGSRNPQAKCNWSPFLTTNGVIY